MPATYEPIATYTLGSAGTIIFSSIPSTYTDLILITRLIISSGSDVDLTINGDSGSNYSYGSLYGTGAGAGGGARAANLTFARLDYYGYADSIVGQICTAHFLNYSNTNIFKTIITQNGNANNGTGTNACLWRSTSAINSIAIIGTYDTGSTATLYGIKAA